MSFITEATHFRAIDKYSYHNKCYLHIWNVSYHVLQHKFDGVYMLQQFKIVA